MKFAIFIDFWYHLHRSGTEGETTEYTEDTERKMQEGTTHLTNGQEEEPCRGALSLSIFACLFGASAASLSIQSSKMIRVSGLYKW